MKKKFAAAVVLILVSIFFTSTLPVFSATPVPSPPSSGLGIGCGGGLGPVASALCKLDNTNFELAGGEFNRIIGVFLGFMTIAAGIWFLFQFITAGFGWMSAGGDKNKTEEAWHKITNSMIGLIIVVSAWILVGVIGSVVGLDILNPGKMFNQLIQP